jgi:acetyltransferase-like isoleucine patch superfamily enzyme
MRAKHLPARQQIRFAYYLALNGRRSLVNALLGEEAAEMRRLRRSGRLLMGPWSYGHPRILAFRHGCERLIVGRYSALAGTWVLGGNHGPKRITTYPLRIHFGMDGDYDEWSVATGDTIVGSDVWTCENCLILPGVTIGDGAVVAAGAVVSKDVPPYAIVGGNPASVLRYRFDEAQREALLDIRWWDWPEERIRAAVPLMESEDADAFIAYARGEQVALSGAAAR